MDALIAGAGIGGLALARGLIADGHRVRVLEQASALRLGGAAVTIFSNGAAALAGLGAPLDGLGGLIEVLEFRDSDGRVLWRTDLLVMHRRTGFPVITVPRDRLLTHLAQALPVDVIELGCGVDAAVVRGDRVEVTDARGGRRTVDVLVGADGYRSAVRRCLVDAAPAVSCGWTTWQGLSQALPELASGTLGVCVVAEAGLCGLMPAGDGLVQWWFDMPDTSAEPEPVSAVEALRKRFAGYPAPVPALLDAIDDTDVQRFPHVVHTIPDRWGFGPSTLVGDAAHVFPPSQAQGANQAFEDAWLLTRALRLGGGPAEALRRYERCRVPRVRRVSRMAASEITNRPPSAVARLVARLMPASLSGHAYLALIRRFSSVLSKDVP